MLIKKELKSLLSKSNLIYDRFRFSEIGYGYLTFMQKTNCRF